MANSEDLLTVLNFKFLRLTPNNPQRPDDRAAEVPAAAQRVRPAGGRLHGRRHQAVLPQL